MADKDKKKKGFFSKLFSGFQSKTPEADTSVVEEEKSEIKTQEPEIKKKEEKPQTEGSSKSTNIPTSAQLNRMKKADIAETAKEFGLDIDTKLTKVKMIEEFNAKIDGSSQKTSQEEALLIDSVGEILYSIFLA